MDRVLFLRRRLTDRDTDNQTFIAELEIAALAEIRVISDRLTTHRISKFKLIITERWELIQVENVLSIRDLPKPVLTGEQSQSTTPAFHTVGILFHNNDSLRGNKVYSNLL